ncbi:galactokinase [Plectosphaerella plurivora]|uniref:Galactokinase n=1 Tax=Plectosphaerella plurivora TaxID=936078 RepID=A0A9P8VKR7_9PEZI|nr:galactokinase [Plectosphaerella plurivora]
MFGTTVPVAQSLRDIYTDDALENQSRRWNRLLSTYESEYGRAAAFVARSPGRVNIIGEHIDYSLYSVLPMAITADALIAVSLDTTPADADTFTVRIANTQPDKFPRREFTVPVAGEVEIDATKHEWSNYFRCGLRAALELLRKKQPGIRPTGMSILMDGTVPAGGGLSSSAAFVSCSALAVMFANGEEVVDKTELTELAIVSERAVGVNSGGMDQSASVFPERGTALFVSFAPKLTAKPVRLPSADPPVSFLIAQSFVTANKYVTGPIHYNLRVVECTLAASYLNAVLNPPGTALPEDSSPLGISLHGLHETYFHNLAAGKSEYSVQGDAAKTFETQEQQLAELIRLTEEALPKEEGYTREEIAKVLGISVEELEARFTTKIPIRAERFKLRQRALHVFAEALRVLEFMALLDSGAGADAADGLNRKLGELLNTTHASCRDIYENSSPEVDELCRIAVEAGSYGSRVTGAGWGGCTVHMVPADKVDAVKAAWDAQYYSKRGDLTAAQKEEATVVSQPGSGSAVLVVKAGSLDV